MVVGHRECEVRLCGCTPWIFVDVLIVIGCVDAVVGVLTQLFVCFREVSARPRAAASPGCLPWRVATATRRPLVSLTTTM